MTKRRRSKKGSGPVLSIPFKKKIPQAYLVQSLQQDDAIDYPHEILPSRYKTKATITSIPIAEVKVQK